MTSTALQTQMSKHPALTASVGAIRVKLDLKYTEQIYSKTLAELEGISFEALAGIRITFLPIIEGHVTQPEGSSNLIFMAQYVEYLTGRRRTLAAVVDLVDGYVPVGVEQRAFEDAFRHSIEASLNECGYTLEEKAPDGLRKMEKVTLGHKQLQYLFYPLTVLRGIDGIDEEKVEVTVEDNAVVLRTPLSIFHHDKGYRSMRSLAGFPMFDPEECYESYFNRVHRSHLGGLNELRGGKNLWVELGNARIGEFKRAFLTTETTLENPFGKIINPDKTETTQLYPNYGLVVTLNESPTNIIDCLPSVASGVLRDQFLTVRIPLDLSAPYDKGGVVIEDIDDWIELKVHGVRQEVEEVVVNQSMGVYDKKVVAQHRREKALSGDVGHLEALQALAATAAEKAAEREEQARREAIRKAVATPSKYTDAIVVDVVDVPPVPPIHYGFFTRLKVALDAFANPGIWKKD